MGHFLWTNVTRRILVADDENQWTLTGDIPRQAPLLFSEQQQWVCYSVCFFRLTSLTPISSGQDGPH
jgi:hypothetical protein